MDTALRRRGVSAALVCLCGQFGVLASLGLLGCGSGDGSPVPRPLTPDLAVLTGCLDTAPAAGESRAKLIGCSDELPSGHLVSGRVGDVLLENSRIKIVVRGFGEGFYLMGTKAGGIVDAAPRGGDDQIKEIVPIFGLKGGAFDEIVITEAGDDGPATLVVRGPLEGIPFVDSAIVTEPQSAIVEQHYILAPDTDALLIRTYLFEDGSPEENIEIGDALFFGGTIESWVPGRGALEGTASIPFLASFSGNGGASNTSYGLTYIPGRPPAVQFADISNIKIALGPTRTVGNPEPVDRWFIVGDGSAASVTSRAWAIRDVALGTVRGEAAPGVEVHVLDASDKPTTIARAGDDGRYSVELPAGSYQLFTDAPGRLRGDTQTVTVIADADTTADLAVGSGGTLQVNVTDAISMTALPARVMVGIDGERRIEYAGADGSLTLPLPTGTNFTLDVSRGMEYDVFTQDPLVIRDGETTTVQVGLERVVDTSGWISLDTHIHSEMSTDSRVPLQVRLMSVAAEGVEVPISTDHDFVTDYGPIVAELGLQDWIAAQTGVETSSLLWGHVNTWPLVPDYERGAGNAIPWYGRSPGQVYALMRERGSHVVIQLNHPRSSSNGNLRLLDFNRETLLAELDPTKLDLPGDTDLSDFDFDTMEVANDFGGPGLEASFKDWLALVASGHPTAATGSSDSHKRSVFIGKTRTYVYVGAGNDDPKTVDLDQVNAAIKARKVVVAQGCFIQAAVVNPGDGTDAMPGFLTNLGDETEAQLHIRLQAPPWIPLKEIVIYSGREIARTIALDASATEAVRYDKTITLPIGANDGFFVVRVNPAGPGTPVFAMPIASFTNPLMYDADGDGAWMAAP